MNAHELAGKPATRELLLNVPRLVSAYYTGKPDAGDPAQRVSFGTSGHRGSSLRNSFNEDHVLAICQAVCRAQASQGHHRTAVHGHGYPCPVRARPGHRARSVCRQRRRRRDPGRPGLHPHAGHLPRHSSPQPRQSNRAV